MSQNFKFGNLTDTGLVRKANEDYYGCFDTPTGFVFVLCDGMGGHIGGAVASQTAVEAIKDYYNASSYNNVIISLQNVLANANNAILEKITENPNLQGMGTTAVLLIIKDDAVYYAHIGDSRIYYFHEKKLFQITSDHSFVQDLVNSGLLNQDEAEKHPRKNEITRALGIGPNIDPTICNIPITAVEKDCFLLCSDGLTGMVSNSFICEVLSNQNQELQVKVSTLINEAKANGGLDNVTVQLIEFDKTANVESNFKPPVTLRKTESKTRKWKSRFNLMHLLLILAILTIGYFSYSYLYPGSGKNVQTKKNDTVISKNGGGKKNDSNKNQDLSGEELKNTANQYDVPTNKSSGKGAKVSGKEVMPDEKQNKIPIPDEPFEKLQYVILKGDNSVVMEKKFHKSWNQLRKEDKTYIGPNPITGKIITITVRGWQPYDDENVLSRSKVEICKKYRVSPESLLIIKEQKSIVVLLK